MAVNPDYLLEYETIDFSRERSSITLHVAEADMALPDAVSGTSGTPAGDILGTLTAMSAGVFVSRKAVAINKIAITPPTDADAQREKKFLVSYSDNVTLRLYNFEVPCARTDTDAWFKPNTDELNLLIAPMTAWKTTFQANILSPDGNAITIQNITLVGRNI